MVAIRRAVIAFVALAALWTTARLHADNKAYFDGDTDLSFFTDRRFDLSERGAVDFSFSHLWQSDDIHAMTPSPEKQAGGWSVLMAVGSEKRLVFAVVVRPGWSDGDSLMPARIGIIRDWNTLYPRTTDEEYERLGRDKAAELVAVREKQLKDVTGDLTSVVDGDQRTEYLPKGRSFHVTLVRARNKVFVYLDGELVRAVDAQFGLTAGQTLRLGGKWSVKAWEGDKLAPTLMPFLGDIEGVRFWRALYDERSDPSAKAFKEFGSSPSLEALTKLKEYGDLIAYVDFAPAVWNSQTHALDPDRRGRPALKFADPLAGVWRNENMDKVGLPANGSTFTDYPVYSFVPATLAWQTRRGAQPEYQVYEDSNYIGTLKISSSASERETWVFTHRDAGWPAIELRHERVGVEVAPQKYRPRWQLVCDSLPKNMPRPFAGQTTGSLLLSRRSLDDIPGKPATFEEISDKGRNDLAESFTLTNNLKNKAVLYWGYNITQMKGFNLQENGCTRSNNYLFKFPKGELNVLDTDSTHVLPVDLHLIQGGTSTTDQTSTYIENAAEYSSMLTRRYGAGLNLTLTSGFDANTASSQFNFVWQAETVTELAAMSSASTGVFVTTSTHEKYKLHHRKDWMRLSTAFKAELRKLYEDCATLRNTKNDEARNRRIFEFYRAWGTHYNFGASYGAMGWWETRTNRRENGTTASESSSEFTKINEGETGDAKKASAALKNALESSWTRGRGVGGGAISNEVKTVDAGDDPVPIMIDLRFIHELLSPQYFPGEPQIYVQLRQWMIEAYPKYPQYERDETLAALKRDAAKGNLAVTNSQSTFDDSLVTVDDVKQVELDLAQYADTGKPARPTTLGISITQLSEPWAEIDIGGKPTNAAEQFGKIWGTIKVASYAAGGAANEEFLPLRSRENFLDRDPEVRDRLLAMRRQVREQVIWQKNPANAQVFQGAYPNQALTLDEPATFVWVAPGGRVRNWLGVYLDIDLKGEFKKGKNTYKFAVSRGHPDFVMSAGNKTPRTIWLTDQVVGYHSVPKFNPKAEENTFHWLTKQHAIFKGSKDGGGDVELRPNGSQWVLLSGHEIDDKGNPRFQTNGKGQELSIKVYLLVEVKTFIMPDIASIVNKAKGSRDPKWGSFEVGAKVPGGELYANRSSLNMRPPDTLPAPEPFPLDATAVRLRPADAGIPAGAAAYFPFEGDRLNALGSGGARTSEEANDKWPYGEFGLHSVPYERVSPVVPSTRIGAPLRDGSGFTVHLDFKYEGGDGVFVSRGMSQWEYFRIMYDSVDWSGDGRFYVGWEDLRYSFKVSPEAMREGWHKVIVAVDPNTRMMRAMLDGKRLEVSIVERINRPFGSSLIAFNDAATGDRRQPNPNRYKTEFVGGDEWELFGMYTLAGAIDELILYDRALQWNEILALQKRPRLTPGQRDAQRAAALEEMRTVLGGELHVAALADAYVNASIKEKFLPTFDKNKDGRIQRTEVQLYDTGEFTRIDPNGDGVATFDEIANQMRPRAEAVVRGLIADYIPTYDTNKDGKISKDDKYLPQAVADLIAPGDRDKDAALTVSELLWVLTPQAWSDTAVGYTWNMAAVSLDVNWWAKWCPALDLNEDGKLSAAECEPIVLALSEQSVTYRDMDPRNVGYLTYEQALQFIRGRLTPLPKTTRALYVEGQPLNWNGGPYETMTDQYWLRQKEPQSSFPEALAVRFDRQDDGTFLVSRASGQPLGVAHDRVQRACWVDWAGKRPIPVQLIPNPVGLLVKTNNEAFYDGAPRYLSGTGHKRKEEEEVPPGATSTFWQMDPHYASAIRIVEPSELVAGFVKRLGLSDEQAAVAEFAYRKYVHAERRTRKIVTHTPGVGLHRWDADPHKNVFIEVTHELLKPDQQVEFYKLIAVGRSASASRYLMPPGKLLTKALDLAPEQIAAVSQIELVAEAEMMARRAQLAQDEELVKSLGTSRTLAMFEIAQMTLPKRLEMTQRVLNEQQKQKLARVLDEALVYRWWFGY